VSRMSFSTALASIGAVVVLVAGPLILWQLAFHRAVRRDIEALTLKGSQGRAHASARLVGLGSEALPEVMSAFAFNETPLERGVTLQRSGLSMHAGPLVLTAMYWLADHAGPDGVTALVQGLAAADHDVRHFAGLTLALIGKKAVPALVTALRTSADAGQRVAAAFSLSLMGADGGEALAPLRDALADEDKDVRLTARFALQQLGPGNEGYWAAIEAARRSRPP